MGFGLRNLCRLRKLRSVRQLPKLSRVLLCRVGEGACGDRLFPTQAGLALFICPVAVEVATKILVAIAPSGWSLSLSRLPPNEAKPSPGQPPAVGLSAKRAIQAHRRFNTLLRDISDNKVKSPGRRPVDCFWHLTRPRLFYTVRRYIC